MSVFDSFSRLFPAEGRIENYDNARLSGKATFTTDAMQVVLPSGAEFTVPKNEVLSLRDLCNGFLETNGAFDIYGRPVVDELTAGGH